jgi:type I restriction enzyme, S subunit
MKWTLTELSKVAKVSSGDGAPQDSSAFGDFGAPFIRAGSIVSLLNGKSESELEKISNIESKTRRMRTYPAGTIVFAKSGMSCMKGLVYELQGDAHIVNHLAAIECGKEIEPRFLLRWFEVNSPARLIANSSYPSIKLSDIRSEKIPLPHLSEQKRIAKILDAAAALRIKRRESIALLDNLIQSTFLDMFGDPVTNPMGWEVKSLSELVYVQGGFAFKSKDYCSQGVRLVKIANVHSDNLRWEETDCVPTEYLNRYNNFALKPGDLVIALTRPIIKSLNCVKIATVGAMDVPSLLNQRVARFVFSGKNTIHKYYLLSFCRTQYFRNIVQRYCSESLQPNMSTKQLGGMLIPIPPLPLQLRFVSIVEAIEKQKARLKAHLAELDTLFASLQSRAFQGEL